MKKNQPMSKIEETIIQLNEFRDMFEEVGNKEAYKVVQACINIVLDTLVFEHDDSK